MRQEIKQALIDQWASSRGFIRDKCLCGEPVAVPPDSCYDCWEYMTEAYIEAIAELPRIMEEANLDAIRRHVEQCL